MSDVDELDGMEPIGSLAEQAAAELDGGEGDVIQPHLPGTDHARVKFVGMAWDTLETPALKSEVTFTVEGIVVGHGEEVMTDGEVRQTAKVKVVSVVPMA